MPEIERIADILCVNDASSDTSGEIISNYQCAQITNVFGLGYGSALQLGYKYADFCAQIDQLELSDRR